MTQGESRPLRHDADYAIGVRLTPEGRYVSMTAEELRAAVATALQLSSEPTRAETPAAADASHLLDRIDSTFDNLCACGCGQPVPADSLSAWFAGPDCQQRWHRAQTRDPQQVERSVDPDYRYPPGPMRWRPDLVAADDDDTNLVPLDLGTLGYSGRFNASMQERADRLAAWRLRLDDGHRYVALPFDGVDVRREPITPELADRVREAWQRLERELTDPRRTVPGDRDPWADVFPLRYGGIRHVPPHLTYLPVPIGGWTRDDAFRRRLCDWLQAHGLDPSQIPESSQIDVDYERRTITVEYLTRLDDNSFFRYPHTAPLVYDFEG